MQSEVHVAVERQLFVLMLSGPAYFLQVCYQPSGLCWAAGGGCNRRVARRGPGPRHPRPADQLPDIGAELSILLRESSVEGYSLLR